MNPRQARRERREAERKAKKAELRRSKANPSELETGERPEPLTHAHGKMREVRLETQSHVPFTHEPEQKLESRRAEISRANAQFSTDPRTPRGKLASSRNSTKHGLTSHQTIISSEDPAAFEALLADLLAEHQPATETETLLVKQMAQSHWLGQRALRLQNECFTEEGVDEKRLALFLRYGTTHGRAFHNALANLQRLQKERRKSEKAQPNPRVGFVSQLAAQAPGEPGFVSQNITHSDSATGFVPETPTQKVSQNAA